MFAALRPAQTALGRIVSLLRALRAYDGTDMVAFLLGNDVDQNDAAGAMRAAGYSAVETLIGLKSQPQTPPVSPFAAWYLNVGQEDIISDFAIYVGMAIQAAGYSAEEVAQECADRLITADTPVAICYGGYSFNAQQCYDTLKTNGYEQGVALEGTLQIFGLSAQSSIDP